MLLFPLLSRSQEIDTIPEQPDIINQQIENIAEDSEDEDVDYTELLDQLEYYKRHPLNLNTATADELKQLVLLNDIQINNLLSHRDRFGKLISIYELQVVNGINLDMINHIKPFVYVADKEKKRSFSIDEMFKYGEHQLFVRYQRVLEEQKGFSDLSDSLLELSPNSRYNGSQEKIYTRYRFNYYKNVSWGITAEKDAGEEFFQGSQTNGYDFYSAHFHLRDIGVLKAFSIGDYSVQFGQGINAWSGAAFGKSAETMNIKKNAQGILPYRSVDENKFLRGAGVAIGLKGFELTTFYSNKKIDANITDQDSLSREVLYISSLQGTGFHRTPSELEDKDAINEKIYGTHLAYNPGRIKLGVSAVKTEFGAELNKDASNYNQFEFNGKENTNIGADYGYIYRNFNFFGEIGQSKSGGIGYLNGVLISLHHHLSLSLLHRHYDRNFHGLMSNAFSESSRNINEDGIFTGFEYKPSKKWRFTAYADHYKFSWLKFRTSAPSEGYDYFTQLKYKPSKKVEMYVRFRQEDKKINSSNETQVDFLDNNSKKNIRFDIKYKLSEAFSFKNRVEWVGYEEGNLDEDNGYLIYQDVKYQPHRKPFNFTARYALFDTDTYNSRIYAFENDVLYAYSIPAYFYKGSRFYIMSKYKFNRHIHFWIRYAQTFLNNKNSIGSGLDEINGNTKSEVKLQVRIKI